MHPSTVTGATPVVVVTPKRLALRVSEAAELLSIGRSKAYELARTGDLPTVRIGKTLRVPVAALEALVQQRAFGSGDEEAVPQDPRR